MPYFIFMLFAFIGPAIVKILTVLGIGFVSYVGINAVLDAAISFMEGHMGQLDGSLKMLLGLAKVDVSINIVLSAVVARATIYGVSKMGTKRTQVWHKPGTPSPGNISF